MTLDSATLCSIRHFPSSSRSHSCHWNFFSASKELLRFIATTIILTHFSGVTAASIIHNYKRSTVATSVKRSRKMDFAQRRRADQNVNLWNFRTFSSITVPQHAIAAASASSSSSSSSSSTSPQSQTNSRRRSNHNQPSKAMVTSTSVSSSSTAQSRPPTVQEMKAQLGPLGLLVATVVEVGITTAGSFISGGIFGYVWGGVSASPTLFKPLEHFGGASEQPRRKLAQWQSKLSSWNGKAAVQARSWGELSAAFSGFHALTRCCRGGKEDRWNSIVGSGLAGAYLSRGGGVQAMMQGAMTYTTFTYVIDFVFGSSSGGGGGGVQRGSYSDNAGQFEFEDTPLMEETDF